MNLFFFLMLWEEPLDHFLLIRGYLQANVGNAEPSQGWDRFTHEAGDPRLLVFRAEINDVVLLESRCRTYSVG